MGLLDSVLGQVIGGLAGSQGTSASTQQGGAWNQSGGAGGQSGGINPLVLALLSLVASRALGQGGAGGLGSTLRDVLTGGSGSTAGGGLGGMFGGNQTGPAGAQTGGGFLDQIGGMLGGGAGPAAGPTPAGPGGMGGLTPGGLGGLLGGGLGGLLERFAQNGHGDVMNSWIGKGANQSIDPQQLDTALGSGTVDELSRKTGLDRGDLLSQLSEALPQVVDGLTPHGRLPEAHEEQQWV